MKKFNYSYCFNKCKDPINYIKERIDKYKVNWQYISINQNLSEEFIREFKDDVNWHNISCNQNLSEEFIREFKEYVNWKYISRYQNLSEKFCNEFNIPFMSNKRNCGKCKRNIYIESGPINIGCFKGTKVEAIKAISNNDYYSKNPLERDQYIKDVEEVFEMYNA